MSMIRTPLRYIIGFPLFLRFLVEAKGVQNIRVEFYKQLRPERKFGSIDELKTAILKNAQETRLYFG